MRSPKQIKESMEKFSNKSIIREGEIKEILNLTRSFLKYFLEKNGPYKIRNIRTFNLTDFNRVIEEGTYENSVMKSSDGNPRNIFLRNYNKGGRCLEIGVNEGRHAIEMLNNLEPSELILIDSKIKVTDELTFLNKLKNVSCIESVSSEASKKFPDKYFDFIYIDGDHSFDGVTSDLELWTTKVKNGGIVSGHDFKMNSNSSWNYSDEGLFYMGRINQVAKAVLVYLDKCYKLSKDICLDLYWEGEIYKKGVFDNRVAYEFAFKKVW